jgi:ABC-2 type transport system permease protein
MIGALAAEWLKLRKRPAVWVLAGVLVGLVAVLQYLLLFLVILASPPNLGQGVSVDALRQGLYPEHFVRMGLGTVSGGIGSAIALILGVLAVGSEYGWSTLKTVLTLRPGRATSFLAKAAAIGVVLVVFDVLMFATAAACSGLVGAYYGAAGTWPGVLDVIKGLLAAWLILAVWAALGAALAELFRQSALAIGLGLIYAILLEGILFSLLRSFSWVQTLQKAFPGANGTALVQSFGSAIRAAAVPQPLVGATQAVVVLAAYLVAFVALATILVRRRDVT